MKIIPVQKERYELTLRQLCVGVTFQLRSKPHPDCGRDDVYLVVKNPYPSHEYLKQAEDSKQYVVNLNRNKVSYLNKDRECKVTRTQVEILNEED
jgi:hypothetical protein